MARLIALVLLVMVMGGAIRVGAASYNPLRREEQPAVRAIVPGDTVFLFHSGTKEARCSLKAGDVLAVSRTAPDRSTLPVGTIRAAGCVGEFCIKGEVLEGSLLLHDLALKDHVYYLVIPEALCSK